MGVALLLEPTPELGKEHESDGRTGERKGLGAGRLGSYLYQNRRLVGQLGVGLLVASLLQRGAPASSGVEQLKRLYAIAIREGYRFYSFGDAMLVLP